MGAGAHTSGEFVSAAARALATARSPAELGTEVLGLTRTIFEDAVGLLAVHDAPGAPLRILAHRGETKLSVVEGWRGGADDRTPVTEADRTGQALEFTSGAEMLARFPDVARQGWVVHPGAYLVVPMRAGGHPVGVLSFARRSAAPFSGEEREWCHALAELCAGALERMRLLDEARAAGARLRQIIDTAGTVVVGLRADHSIFEWNTAAEETFGVSRAEALGQDYVDRFLAPEFREAVAADIRKVLAGTPTKGFEDDAVLPNGQRRTHLWNVDRLLGPDGRPEGIVAIGQDITERKRAEERFAAVFRHAQDAVFVVGPSGIVDCNPAGLRMLGASDVADLRGRSMGQLSPERQPDGRSSLEAAAEHTRRISTDGLLRFDWTHKRLDGGEFPVEVSVARLPVADEVWMVVIWRDIGQRQQLERQLRQAQRMEVADQLVGGVAHDLNNLLTALFGSLEMVRGELAPGSPAATDLDGVERAARGAAALTRRLMAFSRQQVMAPVVLDAGAFVLEAESMLRRLLGERCALATLVPPGPSPIRVDPGQLEQVLINLAVNARDAMPDGGTATLRVHQRRWTADDERPGALPPGDYVAVELEDSGVGMTDDVRARIFEPFFTTKPMGKGTGLGLAVVYGVVTQSGGHVEVRSTPGEGTRLALWFPAQRAELLPPSPLGRPAAPLPPGTSAPRLGTILLVEDEELVRRTVRRLLEHAGYQVFEARHGEDALRLWRQGRDGIHLVLSDVRMPEMSGPELVQRLRAEGGTLPVVFMSGYTADPGAAESLAGEAILHKPFSSAELLARVRESLAPHDGARPAGDPA